MSDIDANGIGSTAPGHYGPHPAQVTLVEATIESAWNVQGDPQRAPFVDEAWTQFDVALPVVPNTTASNGALTAFWLGPGSWLLVAGTASPLGNFAAKRDALNSAGGALFDLSASRVAYTVAGMRAATVLATFCPLDLHVRAFPVGSCASSMLGHVNALFYKLDETPTFTVMVSRSLALDAWHGLCLSAAQHGYSVAPAAPFR